MTENRFFTWLWRLNGLLIAVCGLLILALILWEMSRNWRQRTFPTAATEVLNVTEEGAEEVGADDAETRRFGAPLNPARTGIYALPLYVEQTYRNRGISKETGGNRVNYLVVDTAGERQRWLFPSGPRLITDTRDLFHTPASGARQFLGHVLFVIESDTNGDGRLSRSDSGALLHVSPGWGEPTGIADDVRHILEVRATGPLGFDVIYDSTTGPVLRQISLPGAEVVTEMTLSESP